MNTWLFGSSVRYLIVIYITLFLLQWLFIFLFSLLIFSEQWTSCSLCTSVRYKFDTYYIKIVDYDKN